MSTERQSWAKLEFQLFFANMKKTLDNQVFRLYILSRSLFLCSLKIEYGVVDGHIYGDYRYGSFE